MKNSRNFWNKEYKSKDHLALSTEPAEDLLKFTRWILRHFNKQFLNKHARVLDLGCGNGRNLFYLANTFGVSGKGYDISEEAIRHAKNICTGIESISFGVGSIEPPIPEADGSATFVLDMMTSHFLNESSRTELRKEILRILKPDGWLFLKTFLTDDDAHAKRLLRDHPADEAGSYIHPEIGVLEHTYTEGEILTELEKDFYIHKIVKSHRHKHNTGSKRRSISIYAQKL